MGVLGRKVEACQNTWKNIQSSKGSMGGAEAKAIRKRLTLTDS